ncbi:MAG TPA: hypothetical protein VME46_20565 [Acidimicrobiales bacterium]|nr:hypothetical protein [Acidimicrobiales bacterium]
MASRVTTEQSAGEAAWEYLAAHRPEAAGLDLSVLRLENGWLVQTAAPPEARADTVVMLVNRYGFVEEIGGVVSRRDVHRYLSGINAGGFAQQAV